MIIIAKYDVWSRMANRMFVYAFARILAMEKKCGFIAEPLGNFPNTVPANSQNFSGKALSLSKTFGSHYADMNMLMSYNDNIVVDSYVQKYQYYIKHRNLIQEWYSLKHDAVEHPKNELVLHVRETDYNAIGMTFPAEVYEEAVDSLKYDNYTVVTDNFNSELAKRLAAKGCRILSDRYVETFSYVNNDNIMRDFIYMLTAENLFLSHSSFSWWSAFLGCHDKVYFPILNRKSMWKESPDKNDPDLFIPDSNFIKFRSSI